MTIITGLFPWGPTFPGEVAAVSTAWINLTMNGATTKCASMFSVPKNGTIDKAYVYVVSKTGNPPDYRATIVTVSQGPTTTPYGGSAAQDFTPAVGWNEITFTTPATATRGDMLALAITAGETAPDASNYIVVATRGVSQFGASNIPRGMSSSGGSYYCDSTTGFVNGLRYADGSPVAPIATLTGNAEIQSDTSPDEVGAKFTVPFPCKVVGLYYLVKDALASNAAYTLTFYDTSNNVLAQHAFTTDAVSTVDRTYMLLWTAAPITLTANTVYRLTVTSANISYGFFPQEFVPQNATYDLPAIAEYSRWQRTERTDGGAWTDTPNRLPQATLLLSEITLEYSNDPAPATIESGCPGDTITITGAYFGDTEGTVTFGALPATIVSWAADSIDVIIPVGATDCNVTVTKADAKTQTIAFTLGDDCGGPPVVASIRQTPETPIHTGNPIGAGPNIGLSPVR